MSVSWRCPGIKYIGEKSVSYNLNPFVEVEEGAYSGRADSRAPYSGDRPSRRCGSYVIIAGEHRKRRDMVQKEELMPSCESRWKEDQT